MECLGLRFEVDYAIWNYQDHIINFNKTYSLDSDVFSMPSLTNSH